MLVSQPRHASDCAGYYTHAGDLSRTTRQTCGVRARHISRRERLCVLLAIEPHITFIYIILPTSMLLAIAATHGFVVPGSRPLLPPNSRAVPSRHTSLKFQEVELSDDVRAGAAAGFAAWWEDSDDEVDGHMCSVEGTLPDWLRGRLVPETDRASGRQGMALAATSMPSTVSPSWCHLRSATMACSSPLGSSARIGTTRCPPAPCHLASRPDPSAHRGARQRVSLRPSQAPPSTTRRSTCIGSAVATGGWR